MRVLYVPPQKYELTFPKSTFNIISYQPQVLTPIPNSKYITRNIQTPWTPVLIPTLMCLILTFSHTLDMR